MTHRGSIAGALLLTCVLACNAIAGINDPVDKTPGTTSGGIPPGVPPGVPPGGMDSGGPTPTGAAPFVGTWITNDATQSLSGCNNGAPEEVLTNVVQTLTFTLGDTSGVVTVTNPTYGNCPIRYSVAGDKATVLAGESCTGFEPKSNQNVTFAYVPPTVFTLESATGARAHFYAEVDYQPAGVQCYFEEMSTYTKQ